ncbi:IclR family transcriptional regulator C-terminal domain-containing protein [Leifsonia lichenia]
MAQERAAQQKTAESGDEHFVQSLARGLAVIRAFDADDPSMTLSEVARKTGMSRAAARRFLLTLIDLGYLRTDGREFELTARVLELGYAFLSGQSLPRLATPVLQELSAELGESVSMAVLDGTDIVYVARVHTRRIMSVGIAVGSRFPAYATSMGRVLLAGLDDTQVRAVLARSDLRPLTPNTTTDPAALVEAIACVARDGWASVDQELELGLRSIAVPVRNPSGAVVAAINVSLSAGLLAQQHDAGRVERIRDALAAAADRLLEIQRTVDVSTPMSGGAFAS